MELVKSRKERKMREIVCETETRKKDMVDELLEAEEGFIEEEMVDFLLAMLVSGPETTPAMMTLIVKFLPDSKRTSRRTTASKRTQTNPRLARPPRQYAVGKYLAGPGRARLQELRRICATQDRLAIAGLAKAG
ncbi:hypothetical protein KSP40_PGU016389 [Platanthera guangdongensis]|uniref:Uncharacterized protein n=1 Tax=Platanthera guangdongensis TaxID=2320717 RepID=A0ABR2MY68_9ASPA